VAVAAVHHPQVLAAVAHLRAVGAAVVQAVGAPVEGGRPALVNMNIIEIRKIFNTGDQRQIEMMARNILVHGRSHEYMQRLSHYADEFNELLLMTNPADKEYLALVYLLAEHLKDIKNGTCACSIVKKPMYNSPERLGGILEVLDEKLNSDNYSINVHSRCLACGKEYVSTAVESGFGQKVIWNEQPRTT
jgi:hypothetical protein